MDKQTRTEIRLVKHIYPDKEVQYYFAYIEFEPGKDEQPLNIVSLDYHSETPREAMAIAQGVAEAVDMPYIVMQVTDDLYH